ncbi:hypothetical protein NEIFLAOT_00408 [Neisseria flavescens NRL30031/H210]|uniref:Lipoprotein n=1 Tax=Neisseria flavescens NRL30031/H210 TaxID=546264 RepID=C0EKG4_NEIFL|nr:hypothetical protein NEIFLAOT_00408 [Neisseria flavescens NRL30031/H210]
MNIKTNTYLALAVLSASLLSGCDKVSTFFGKDENKELVQRIETNTDDGKVSMLLPDFAQLVAKRRTGSRQYSSDTGKTHCDTG